MTAANGTAVLERVRQALAAAEADNQPAPSQSALAKQVGTSRHHIRQALAKLVTNDANPAPTGETNASLVRQPANQPAPWRISGDLTSPAPQPPGWWATYSPPGPQPVVPAYQPAPAIPAKRVRLWPLVVIGLAAAVAVWSGWVGLGGMTGFGVITPLPGMVDGFQLNTAVTLPISVEAYAAFALRVWLAATYTARTTRFAKRSAWGSLAVGAGAQVAFHLLAANGYVAAPWMVTMLVSCVPVGVLALAASLAHLVRHDRQAGHQQ